MQSTASARSGAAVCSSAQQQRKQQRAAAPALKAAPKLATGLAANAALAAATSAEPTPFGGAASGLPPLPSVDLPSLELPALELPALDLPDLDISGLGLDSIDPLAVAAGAAVVVIPLALGALVGGGGGPRAKAVPAPTALQALEADPSVLLVDIRSKAEAREAGGPNLKGITKRPPLALPYTTVVRGELVVDEEFGARLAAQKGVEAEGKPLILLDSDGSEAVAAAKAIFAELPKKKVFYVAGGAEAWREAGLPWKEPVRLALPDLSNLTLTGTVNAVVGGAKALADDFNEAPTVTKGLLAAGAVAGAGVFLFSQAELLLEVAGIFAAGQFLVKNLLFKEDREKTLTELKKVAEEVDLTDLPEDLTRIASKLVEDPTATAAPTGTRVLSTAAAASNGNGAANGASDGNGAAAAGSSAAANAAEARAWIDAWRAKQRVNVSA